MCANSTHGLHIQQNMYINKYIYIYIQGETCGARIMHYMLGTPATNSLRLKIGHPKRKRSSNHPFSGLLLVSSREGRQSWYITCMIFACSRVFAEFLTAKGKLKTTQSKDLSRNRCPQGSPRFPWRGSKKFIMDVSENSGTPKSSILIEFSIINHPFWGTPIFGNTHMVGSWWGINSFLSVFSGHFVGTLTLEVSSLGCKVISFKMKANKNTCSVTPHSKTGRCSK